MALQYDRGTKIFIKLVGGDKYVGTFYSGNDEKITLNNVAKYPSGIEQHFLTCFYKMEISSIRILKDADDNAVQENSEIKHDDKQCITQEIAYTSTEVHEDYNKWMELCNTYCYIDAIDEKFTQSLEDINQRDLVAVEGLCSSFANFSKISLLAIATRDQIYIYDIKLCGEKAFENGLKDFLQSHITLKVVHNSMILVHCLHKYHEVTLEKMFDTQVAHYMLAKKKGEDPDTMIQLDECIKIYLGLPENNIRKLEISSKYLLERALSTEVKEKACFSVVYLIPLKTVLEAKMLEDFNRAVEWYMDSMRYADPLIAKQMNNDDVPKELSDMQFNLI